MKTILLTTILACSGIISAQTPAFVSHWEGAPDQLKIKSASESEYATSIEINKQKIVATTNLPKKKDTGKKRKLKSDVKKRKRLLEK